MKKLTKTLIVLFSITTLISCNEPEQSIQDMNPTENGIWFVSQRSKAGVQYPVTDCEKQSTLSLNESNNTFTLSTYFLNNNQCLHHVDNSIDRTYSYDSKTQTIILTWKYANNITKTSIGKITTLTENQLTISIDFNDQNNAAQYDITFIKK